MALDEVCHREILFGSLALAFSRRPSQLFAPLGNAMRDASPRRGLLASMPNLSVAPTQSYFKLFQAISIHFASIFHRFPSPFARSKRALRHMCYSISCCCELKDCRGCRLLDPCVTQEILIQHIYIWSRIYISISIIYIYIYLSVT